MTALNNSSWARINTSPGFNIKNPLRVQKWLIDKYKTIINLYDLLAWTFNGESAKMEMPLNRIIWIKQE